MRSLLVFGLMVLGAPAFAEKFCGKMEIRPSVSCLKPPCPSSRTQIEFGKLFPVIAGNETAAAMLENDTGEVIESAGCVEGAIVDGQLRAEQITFLNPAQEVCGTLEVRGAHQCIRAPCKQPAVFRVKGSEPASYKLVALNDGAGYAVDGGSGTIRTAQACVYGSIDKGQKILSADIISVRKGTIKDRSHEAKSQPATISEPQSPEVSR